MLDSDSGADEDVDRQWHTISEGILISNKPRIRDGSIYKDKDILDLEINIFGIAALRDNIDKETFY